MPRKTWSKAEEQLLRDLYPTMNTRALANKLGKPYEAVKSRASLFGLLKDKEYKQRTSYGPWTEEKDQILIKEYAMTSNKELCEKLEVPDHSLANRARRLNLRKDPGYIKKVNAEWPEAHVKYLEDNYGKKSRTEIAKHLGRTAGAVKSKATKLGLKVPSSNIRLLHKTNAGTFRKDNDPGNTLENGAITIRHARSNRKSKPYYFIRLGKQNWYPLHQYLWELMNGKPEKNMCVAFKDGNTLNVLYDNLELITRAENMKRNSGSLNLPDGFVASLMTRHDPELKEELLKHPEIIATKRMQLKLNRKLKNTEE